VACILKGHPMVCASPASPAPRRRWQRLFLAILPAIVKHAKTAFRHARGQDREDKIQGTVANALVAFRRLVQLKKTDLAYPSALPIEKTTTAYTCLLTTARSTT
jgi:hypothetical protein